MLGKGVTQDKTGEEDTGHGGDDEMEQLSAQASLITYPIAIEPPAYRNRTCACADSALLTLLPICTRALPHLCQATSPVLLEGHRRHPWDVRVDRTAAPVLQDDSNPARVSSSYPCMEEKRRW